MDVVLNNTTGVLLSCAYSHPDTRIGLTLDTGIACGTNACYVENYYDNSGLMVINTEWGNYGEKYGELFWLTTNWDRQLDKSGKQQLEKMVGWRYLGELVRLILLDLKSKKLILTDCDDVADLSRRGSFTTRHMCQVESDPLDEFALCLNVWKELGVNDPSEEDCTILRAVCEAVSRRCCLILAIGIAALIKKIGQKDVTVAVDGNLFR